MLHSSGASQRSQQRGPQTNKIIRRLFVRDANILGNNRHKNPPQAVTVLTGEEDGGIEHPAQDPIIVQRAAEEHNPQMLAGTNIKKALHVSSHFRVVKLPGVT